jgi:hypothetical protein
MERIWSCFVHGLGQASKPIKSRPSQAEGPQPGESLLISRCLTLRPTPSVPERMSLENRVCLTHTLPGRHSLWDGVVNYHGSKALCTFSRDAGYHKSTLVEPPHAGTQLAVAAGREKRAN